MACSEAGEALRGEAAQRGIFRKGNLLFFLGGCVAWVQAWVCGCGGGGGMRVRRGGCGAGAAGGCRRGGRMQARRKDAGTTGGCRHDGRMLGRREDAGAVAPRRGSARRGPRGGSRPFAMRRAGSAGTARPRAAPPPPAAAPGGRAGGGVGCGGVNGLPGGFTLRQGRPATATSPGRARGAEGSVSRQPLGSPPRCEMLSRKKRCPVRSPPLPSTHPAALALFCRMQHSLLACCWYGKKLHHVEVF